MGSKANKGPGSGITAPGSEIKTRGIGISCVFRGIRDRANNKNGCRDQNSHRFWNQESTFCVRIWDQLRKNISLYDPVCKELRWNPAVGNLFENQGQCRVPFLDFFSQEEHW